ncbi:MAG: SDR family oxidoreductase [Candidatus Pelagadaptatus aseana]|uniref:SDR family oxidoreductase n=1 Tax=Candidatus Pelagadaptatus aseana TaxID=3120508 RepID=UPI0039B362EA
MAVTLDFKDKVVVVVGGTSGINRGIAERFAAQGACVAVASRSQDKVDDTVASLKSAGAPKAVGQAFDVRDPDAVAAGLKVFHEQLGDFDILVSGAAGNFPALISDMSVNAFRTVVEIDLMGTIHVMKGAYPYLKKPGSSIINISAPQGYQASEAQGHVGAAKAGVDQITRVLALEWGGEGIRINSVVPGFIADTEGVKRLSASEDSLNETIDYTPLNRIGEKNDVANMCLMLSSELSSYVTGQVIEVDGGLYLRGSSVFGKALGDMLRSQKA